MKIILALLLVAGIGTAFAQRNPNFNLVAEAFNKNFDRLAKLTCSGPVEHYREGDVLSVQGLDAKFKIIIDALEQNKCKR